ncbi:MAG: geranylgeranylglycerol-phosphate geranylgeranyltransferase [Patescibacteria group bacterium]|nr:geranylgeranylglycerol-phosphate geranylgeranyltransferase [Patescibacteria group bacterium]
METFQNLIKMSRPQNALMPVTAFFFGSFIGNPYIEVLNDRTYYYSFLTVLFLSMFATLHNDLEDYSIDKANGRDYGLHGKDAVEKKTVKQFCWLLILGTLFSAFLSGQFEIVSIFAILSLLFAYAYNSKPLRLSRKPNLSIISLTFCMATLPLLLGYYLGSIGSSYSYLILVSILVGTFLQRFAISMLKDYKDVKGDKEHNKKTFLIAFGPRITRFVSIIVSIFGYLLIGAGIYGIISKNMASMLVLCTLSLFSLYIVFVHFSLKSGWQNKFNNKLFHKIIKLDLIYSFGILLCLYIW